MGKFLEKFFTVVFAGITGLGWQWTNLLQKNSNITIETQTKAGWALTGLFLLQQIYLVLPKPASQARVHSMAGIAQMYLARLLADYYSLLGTEGRKDLPLVRANVMLQTVRWRGIRKSLRIYYTACPAGSSYSADEISLQWKKGQGIAGTVWKNGKESSYDSGNPKDKSAADTLPDKHKQVTGGLKSALAVPIWSDGQCVGILNLDSDEPISKSLFDRDDLRQRVRGYANELSSQCFSEGVAA